MGMVTVMGRFVNDMNRIQFYHELISNEAPIFTAEDKVLLIGDDFNPLDGVSATDKEDGDIILTEANIAASDVDIEKIRNLPHHISSY